MFKIKVVCVILAGILSQVAVTGESAIAAELLFLQDFEQNNWEGNFRSGAWQGRVDRTESNPRSGNYSLRGNNLQDRIDPITGLPGEGNLQLEWKGDNFTNYTEHEVFIRFWIRYDDASWLPNATGKTFYLTDDNVGTAAFYFTATMNSNNSRLSDNGAYTNFCRENWGYQKAYLRNGDNVIVGADNTWHKIELYLNYDDNYIIFWIDGIQLTGAGSHAPEYYPDGVLPIPDEFHLRGLQITYVHDSDLADSVDGPNGYACGFQLDDFEVWDTLPPDVGNPPDSSGPGVPGTPIRGQ